MPTETLVAVTPGGDITDDMLAGYYTWFSIPETSISVAKVRKAFKDAGLDAEVLPKARRPEHVAQEAIRKVQRVTSNGHREEIRVEQVDRNKNYLIYQVTRHVQDKENRVIEHPKALRVIFSFADDTLEFEPLDGAKAEDVQPLIDEISANYDANATKMPGRKLRTHMRHYIEAAGAESMRDSGAIYFLTKRNPIRTSSKLYAHHGPSIDGGELLESFDQMLSMVYGRSGGSDFHIVPCVNDEGQRAYLARKFMENIADDLKSFRDECIELVSVERSKRPRADLRDRLIDQRAAIDDRRARFQDLLGTTMSDLDRDMQLADKALTKFITEAGF